MVTIISSPVVLYHHCLSSFYYHNSYLLTRMKLEKTIEGIGFVHVVTDR